MTIFGSLIACDEDCCGEETPACEPVWSDDFNRADSDTVGNGWVEANGDWDIVSNAMQIGGGAGGFGIVRQDTEIFGTGETLEDVRRVSAQFQISTDTSGGQFTMQVESGLAVNFIIIDSNEAELSLIADETVTATVTVSVTTQFTMDLCWLDETGDSARVSLSDGTSDPPHVLEADYTGTPDKIQFTAVFSSSQAVAVDNVIASKTLETDPLCPPCIEPGETGVCGNCEDPDTVPTQLQVDLPDLPAIPSVCQDYFSGSLVLDQYSSCWWRWGDTPVVNFDVWVDVKLLYIEATAKYQLHGSMWSLAHGAPSVLTLLAFFIKEYDDPPDCTAWDSEELLATTDINDCADTSDRMLVTTL